MNERIKITSAQIRAARALLRWSTRELSERSGVSVSAIHRAERADSRPRVHERSLAGLKSALERFGVEFLDDSGVRLHPASRPSREAGVDPSSRQHNTKSERPLVASQ
jgi:transcriptional regulator with XRE-family HTH domain